MASMQDVLTAPTRLIISDLSGTLSPYHPDPERVQVLPDTADAVRRLSAVYPLVIVTGRQARAARRVLGSNVGIFGQYGGEFLASNAQWPIRNEAWFARAEDVAEVVGEHRRDLAAAKVLVQSQGATRMLHWGSLEGEERERARRAAEAVAEVARAAGLAVYPLSASIDIRPASIDKDAAIDWALEDMYPSVRRVVYLGDDLSDVAAFERLRELDASGRLDAVCTIGVLHEDRPQPVRDHADEYAEGIEGVTNYLRQMAELREHAG